MQPNALRDKRMLGDTCRRGRRARPGIWAALLLGLIGATAARAQEPSATPAATPPAGPSRNVDAAARVTEHGREREIIGEVVELGCYLRDGARGLGHRPCALTCSRAGAPLGIVEDDTDELYPAALRGPASDVRTLLEDHRAARVRTSGRVYERAGGRLFVVEHLERLSPP